MSLPQLIAEDVDRLDWALTDLLTKSEASAAMIIDKGGFLVSESGTSKKLDTTTLAALAAAAFAATQSIASLVDEENFNCVYQQGEKFSMVVLNIDQYSLLVIVFDAQISVGAVKYFAANTTPVIAKQFLAAHNRNPSGVIDLSIMNLEDSAGFFRRKSQAADA